MEILFRGFHPDEHGGQTIVVGGKKVKGEWRQGCFFQIWEYTYILWGTTNGVPNMAEVIPSTVGQFTGLTDKGGKKIFQGDVVRCWDEVNLADWKAFIEFGNPNCEYNWGWQLRKISGEAGNTDILLWVDTEDTGAYTEVIGTIYDEDALNEMP